MPAYSLIIPLDNSNSDDSQSRGASFIHRLVRLHVTISMMILHSLLMA